MPGSANTHSQAPTGTVDSRRGFWRLCLAASVVLFLTGLPLSASAQDDTPYIEAGGVRIPTRPTPDRPDTLTPQNRAQSRDRGDTQSVRGREAGRATVDAEGNEYQVYQSSRIAGVSVADSRERFDWFYDAEEVYYGIIPNIRDSLPHISGYQRRGSDRSQPNAVTWIGFQPFGGFTRVFVQLARQPNYDINEYENEEGVTIEIVFENTRLSLSNFYRLIDATFFGRSVDFIDAEQIQGRRSRVLIWLNEPVEYEVSDDGEYLYLDFQDTRD